MNEWINERFDLTEWMNEWMNEWKNEWIDTNEWMSESQVLFKLHQGQVEQSFKTEGFETSIVTIVNRTI